MIDAEAGSSDLVVGVILIAFDSGDNLIRTTATGRNAVHWALRCQQTSCVLPISRGQHFDRHRPTSVFVQQRHATPFASLGVIPAVGLLPMRGRAMWLATRQVFLSDCSHRIRFIYLPKHTSWLNQIEIVFGIVGRRTVRRGNFPSLAALKDRLLEFIDDFNRTFAKPFRWTYTGRPVTAETVKRPVTWKENWASRRTNGKTLALMG